MTLYGFVLFIHVVAAITLVGSSAYAHVMSTTAANASSLEGARTPVRVLGGIFQVTKFASILTLLAGVYLTFERHWWGQGWVVVALVLFAGAGAAANVILEPWGKRVAEAAAAADAGAFTRLREVLTESRIVLAAWIMTATDVTILLLMTAKPGYPVAIAATLIAWIAGVALALRQQRAEQTALAVSGQA